MSQVKYLYSESMSACIIRFIILKINKFDDINKDCTVLRILAIYSFKVYNSFCWGIPKTWTYKKSPYYAKNMVYAVKASASIPFVLDSILAATTRFFSLYNLTELYNSNSSINLQNTKSFCRKCTH